MTIKKIKDSSGQEHGIDYEALENLPVIYCKTCTVLEETTVDCNISPSIDLSSILPNDGKCYLATFRCVGRSAKQEDAIMRSALESSIDFTASGFVQGFDIMLQETIDLIVAPDRLVTVKAYSNVNYSGCISVHLTKYQKVNAVKVEG